MKKISLSHKVKKHKIAFKNFFFKKPIFNFSNFWRRFKKFKKVPKKIASFFGDVHEKIERNKFLSNEYFTRIVIILFFLGINIQLLPFFLKTNRVTLPENILNILDQLKIIDKDEFSNNNYFYPEISQKELKLEPLVILDELNKERTQRELEPFKYSDQLASAAAELLVDAEKYDYELQNKSFVEELKTALENAGYNYAHVGHNMVVGPLTEAGVVDAWFSDEKQVMALFEDDYEEVGFATKIIKTKYNETLGVTVQVLGKPMTQTKKVATPNTDQAQKPQTQPKIVFPEISNQEVFEALNSYRQSHTVHTLSEDENLCRYAEKRVNDLVAFGTLDNHQGFKDDFADPENLPEPIKNFNGSKIAENLAYQYCRNMSTGDSFIAQTGTAIIEWCFDSSTAGHREAQLSREYNRACVRSANGMYVVIFGGD